MIGRETMGLRRAAAAERSGFLRCLVSRKETFARFAAFLAGLLLLMPGKETLATVAYDCHVLSMSAQYHDLFIGDALELTVAVARDHSEILWLSLSVEGHVMVVPDACLEEIEEPELSSLFVVGESNGTFFVGLKACVSYEPGHLAKEIVFHFSRREYLYRIVSLEDDDRHWSFHDYCFHQDYYQCPFEATLPTGHWLDQITDSAPPSPVNTKAWSEETARGDKVAPYKLGVLAPLGIEFGKVKIDRAAAFYWGLVAAYWGLRDACDHLFYLYYRTSDADIKKAHGLFEEWRISGRHSRELMPQ